MKKTRVIAVTAAMMIFSGIIAQAEAVDPATVQELIDANQALGLLEGHEDVTIHSVGYGQNNTTADSTWYYSADVIHEYSDSIGEQNWFENGHWYFSNQTEDGTVDGEHMYLSEGQFEQDTAEYRTYFYLQITDTEEPVSLTEEDGQLILMTQDVDAESVTAALTGLGQTDPYEYQDGMIMQCAHYFDAETKEMTRIVSTLISPDGTSCLLSEDTMLYDTGAEEEEDWLLALKNPKETRTITLIMDPDTAEEKTRELIVAKEAEVTVLLDEESYSALYQDRACTIPWETPAEKNDETIYTRK